MVASMLGDLRAGRRLEVEWLAGAVDRLGRSSGVPTPINRTIYAALRPYADGTAAPGATATG
jgi:2-dehydropantoate 2-reductase